MKSILHLSTTGKSVVDDFFLPQAHLQPPGRELQSCLLQERYSPLPEPSGSAWPCHLPSINQRDYSCQGGGIETKGPEEMQKARMGKLFPLLPPV